MLKKNSPLTLCDLNREHHYWSGLNNVKDISSTLFARSLCETEYFGQKRNVLGKERQMLCF